VRFLEIAVEDDTSVKAAADRVRQEDGKLDALANNVGISGAFVEPADQNVDDIRQVYEINVSGRSKLRKLSCLCSKPRVRPISSMSAASSVRLVP
jgi:NAD(P)-dependent dehydrogenase (short-subunit alcohol dehydrogenase family)